MDINKKIYKAMDESKIFLTKKWLSFCALSLKAYFATKRIFMVVFLVGILVSLAFLLYVNYEKITGYLLILNADSQGNLNEVFPSLFIAIGASILGVLAITFSLSLFAIQQAADKHTPTVLSSFLKDRTNNYIFWSIASISLIFFAFAILPLDKFIFLEVILTFVLVFLIFLLLKKQYAHIIRLVNPVQQIIFRHNEAIGALNKIDKRLNLMIKIRAIQPGSERSRNIDNEENKEINKNEQKELLRAGLILRRPDLFNDVLRDLNQIYALINTYIARKDYQVIKSGFNAIYYIVSKYIDVRNGTFFSSSIIQAYDHSSDSFLNDVFEKLTAIQRIASKNKDLELSKEIIDCFSKIAIKCTEIRYRATALTAYTHCMLAVQYMQQSIEDTLNVDLLDIGINGSQSQKSIGLVLISKNAYIDIRIILENLSKIAMYGIAKPKATYLIAYPLQAYSLFLRAFMFDKNVDDKLFPKCILEKVKEIVDMYIRFKDLVISPLSFEMEYSLGDFIDLSKPIAMPNIFNEAYAKITDKKTDGKDKECLISKILDFGHEVWHFYDELSKSAAEKESFLIHFIDSNLAYISMMLLKIYQINELEEEQKKEVLKDINWIISDYRRIYYYHKKISSTYEIQILENLLRIGYEFNRLSLLEELDQLIDVIVSIAELFLEKQENSYGYDPIRILKKAVYLCILNGSDPIKDKFIIRVNDKFWRNYLKKFQQHKNLLFEELSQVDPVRLRLNGPHLSFENNMLSEFKKENIINIIEYLKKNLKTDNKIRGIK